MFTDTNDDDDETTYVFTTFILLVDQSLRVPVALSVVPPPPQKTPLSVTVDTTIRIHAIEDSLRDSKFKKLLSLPTPYMGRESDFHSHRDSSVTRSSYSKLHLWQHRKIIVRTTTKVPVQLL